VPDLDARAARGQIDILDHAEWYQRAGRTDTDGALRGWVDREYRALAQGWAGLRLTGNTAWLERSGWSSFMEYESRVSGTFAPRRILGLCSYSLDRCGADDVLDVVRHHEFALARRDGAWELLESAALKAAKAELARANADLEQHVRERTADLERALRSRDDFLSIAAHELRTPVTALRLALESFLRAHERGTSSPEEGARRVARAAAQTERLAKLVNDLLDVSRARSGDMLLALDDVDVARLACDVSARLSERLARAGCVVSVRTPGPVVGRWDRLRLEQVITSLLANAARHAPGKPVELAVDRARDGGAVLVVSDHGPGIPVAERERIFEEFTRLDPAHAAGGFGLGLWIVRRIVEAHGGTVTVGGASGEGATFMVSLPPAPPEPAGWHGDAEQAFQA
jgi:signal transduction histidine kinase